MENFYYQFVYIVSVGEGGGGFSRRFQSQIAVIEFSYICIFVVVCGLIYVGETKGLLNNRISGHRFLINNGCQQLLYKHFYSTDHSVLYMKLEF